MESQMSPREFRDYLTLLGRLLRLRASQREAIAEELRGHLEERLAALAAQGVEPQEAISTALAEFGDAAALAAEFSAISKAQKRRWIMRATVGSVCATLVLVGVIVSLWPESHGDLSTPLVLAQQPEAEPEAEPFADSGPAEPKSPATANQQLPTSNEQTWERLQKLGAGEFDECPLRDVLNYLADTGEFQFYLDPRGLQNIGLAADTPVTLHLKHVPLEMILRLVLREKDLTYTLDHGVVMVTDGQGANEMPIRVYPVADLLRAGVSVPPPQTSDGAGGTDEVSLSVNFQVEQPEAPKDKASPPAFYDPAPFAQPKASKDRSPDEPKVCLPKKPDKTVPDRRGDLIDLLTAVIEPTSWDTVGGPGSIQPFDETLVISQTWQVHRQIETLLADLRQAIAEQKKK